MKSEPCIYEIKNLENDKVYIGLTKDPKVRFRLHRSELRANNHGNDHLQNAWNKYGEDSFEFNVIEYCDKEDLGEREKHYIKEYNALDKSSGYNLSPGGANPDRPEFVKEKIRKSMYEHYENNDGHMKGKSQDESTKQLIREAQKKHYRENPDHPKYDMDCRPSPEELSEMNSGEDNPFYGETHTIESREKEGKLKWWEVKQIKKLLRDTDLIQSKIAEFFGVSRYTVSDIKLGKKWDIIEIA